MYTITKEFTFEAAHHLPQMPDGHQCKRQHGHSYRVIIELQARQLNEKTGFIRDFGELGVFKDYVDRTLDHKDLAVVLGNGELTTAERMALFLFQVCHMQLGLNEVTAVTVCETAKTSATYRQDLE